ncbi:MAG: L-threonylcarbamoyladenylate synthase [Candidatus Omnitrophica bacterium]|jgi:tRNA threonylcarbamoyl adenosine modification protein (Sua5/YciO/YrdC/YwlC family)|nr:L-threonylcarbamoyladenylate synthase [Candidatus Omnitrophota bacterium]MDD5661408.1 L-threonylcarbamoyladenylate synthase [Candidatus Omnitrophota bacterium]
MSLTKIIKINPLQPQDSLINQAAKIITSGGLVIIPTDTVYGVAANSLDKKALDKLYEIKKRPKDKPFAILISDKARAEEFSRDIPVVAYKLMHKFWPGPLTIILNAAEQNKVGLRIPDNQIALGVIARADVPLACPSANISDNPAPGDFQQAIKDLDGLVDLAIDAGPTKLGVESTIVDLSAGTLKIVRYGAIKDEEINAVTKFKRILFVCTGNSCRSVMAEMYLKKLLTKMKREDVEVSSAGMMALEGAGASFETRQVLAQEGIDAGMHRAQRVTKELVDRADIILVMEKIHEERVLELAPRVKNRLFLLKEFAKINDNSLNIADPVGGSYEFYKEIFSTIKDAVERISKII